MFEYFIIKIEDGIGVLEYIFGWVVLIILFPIVLPLFILGFFKKKRNAENNN